MEGDIQGTSPLSFCTVQLRLWSPRSFDQNAIDDLNLTASLMLRMYSAIRGSRYIWSFAVL